MLTTWPIGPTWTAGGERPAGDPATSDPQVVPTGERGWMPAGRPRSTSLDRRRTPHTEPRFARRFRRVGVLLSARFSCRCPGLRPASSLVVPAGVVSMVDSSSGLRRTPVPLSCCRHPVGNPQGSPFAGGGHVFHAAGVPACIPASCSTGSRRLQSPGTAALRTGERSESARTAGLICVSGPWGSAIRKKRGQLSPVAIRCAWRSGATAHQPCRPGTLVPDSLVSLTCRSIHLGRHP